MTLYSLDIITNTTTNGQNAKTLLLFEVDFNLNPYLDYIEMLGTLDKIFLNPFEV